MEKAQSYRFYPTPEQESLLRRTLGCVRLVYNKALHERTQGWYERQEKIGYPQTSSMLTSWKKQQDLDFLNEVSCVPVQQETSCRSQGKSLHSRRRVTKGTHAKAIEIDKKLG